ncbi:MAG TPA: TIGR01459 family HAD-type hydrolase [Caulobacteraceae bacterium]|nr:TIGR01459 family HAD-type hydrolase [Caulobacteraceae bacterium]
MSAPSIIAGLSEIADCYDAVLCDVWGVIHNGRESFPEACEALVRFQQERGPVVLISNVPRPSRFVLSQLDQLKVPREAWSGFVASGDATFEQLVARAPGPAWALGPARDAGLYEGSGVEIAELPEQAAFISCTGLFDDDIETPEDYRERLQICADRGLEMICANPDLVVQKGDKMIYCAGALAQLYEELGGKVLMAGKPFSPIYQLSYAEADRLAGRPVPRDRILAIGDGLPTDVKGANREGLDLLFVAGGIHAAELAGPNGRMEQALVDDFLRRAEASARWAAPRLEW